MKNIILFLKRKALYYAIVRYTLSSFMMSFGIMKVIGMQFSNIAGPTSSYHQSLEYLTGIQLTWAFLGYSMWLQVLLGLFECVPACLLLFRRTAFTGAILLFPMTLGVCLINFAMHLWSDTQLISIVLLSLNLVCFLFEWPGLRQIISIVLGPKIKYRNILPEVIFGLILISIPVVRKVRADYGRSTQTILTGDWFHGHPDEYTLVSEKINDSLLPSHLLKIYFGTWDEYSEISDSTGNWDGYKRYSVDEPKQEVTISSYQNRRSILRGGGYYFLSGNFHYSRAGDSLLLLSQKINNSASHIWIFKKRVISPNKTY